MLALSGDHVGCRLQAAGCRKGETGSAIREFDIARRNLFFIVLLFAVSCSREPVPRQAEDARGARPSPSVSVLPSAEDLAVSDERILDDIRTISDLLPSAGEATSPTIGDDISLVPAEKQVPVRGLDQAAPVRAPEQPYVSILYPHEDEIVENPVTFVFEAGGVDKVALFADNWPLQRKPFSPESGRHFYEFSGVDVARHLVLEGYDANRNVIATDELDFMPSRNPVIRPPGFNRYVVEAIDDVTRYPRDGTYPYCWRKCPGSMGFVHNTSYLGIPLWDGEGTCFCTGHTLEIFLDAISRWQKANGFSGEEPFGALTYESVLGGEFYQYWQGFGVTREASSANAFQSADIGYNIYWDAWDSAQPGDFANISRSNGTGHAVVFHSWLRDNGRIIGLRYYGCNGGGSSQADPEDPDNRKGISGPSYVSEYFVDHGGKVLPEFVFIGHIVDPVTGY